MLKLTSLAIGLLTVLSLAPNAAAMTATTQPGSIERPAVNLHSQIILKIGDRGYSRRSNYQRRRELGLERQRAAARRRQYRGRQDRYERGDYRRDR
jgi:hypothetical protein